MPLVWGDFGGVIQRELINKNIAVATIQAINRVRCRRVIDSSGNCEPTDVFLFVPSGARGDALVEAIKTEMPGIRVSKWQFGLDGSDGKQTRKPRSNHLESALVFLEKCECGTYKAGQLQHHLGISRQTWGKLKDHFQTPGPEVLGRLQAAGVEVLQSLTRQGKVKLSFVKA